MAFVYSYGKKQFKSHVFGIRELTISHVKYTSVQITQRELQYNKIDDVTRKVHNFLTFAFA